MFGTKKGNIAARLEEGRSWVRSLEADVALTESQAEEVNGKIAALQVECAELDSSIAEGKQVASNFKTMLVME